MERIISRLDSYGRREIRIEGKPARTLTVGEAIFFIIGVLIMFFGGKIRIKPAKARMALGLLLIFLGEAIF